MTTHRLFRSSAFAVLALITRAAAWGQQPAPGSNPVPGPLPPVKMQYDGDAKTGYSATNTGKMLRIRLWVADSLQQRKILENGLELWVDTKGRKNKTTGILFPLAAHAPQPGNAPAPTIRRQAKPSLLSLIQLQKEIKLVGFGEELNGLQNQHHPSGIDVALRMVNDTLFYEAQVPLPLLAGTTGDKSRISIGIIEKGKDPALFAGGDMPPGGGPPPGGGEGMGPGGPPPGDGPPEDMDIEQFANNVIWYKFDLYR